MTRFPTPWFKSFFQAFKVLDDDLEHVDPKQQVKFLKTKLVNAKQEIHELENVKGALVEKNVRH
jgi:hypothetical protein